MENLVQYLAEQLVDHPEDVKTNRVEAGNGDVTIELRVHAEDMGKVIGKQGRIAKSIRTLVKAAAAKENKQIRLFCGYFGMKRTLLRVGYILKPQGIRGELKIQPLTDDVGRFEGLESRFTWKRQTAVSQEKLTVNRIEEQAV